MIVIPAEPTAARLCGHADSRASPTLAPGHLDSLWFQVAGTVCNIACTHCFISCSPENRSFGFLTLEDVRRRLRESVDLGVREYYFTGGEPFIHPDIVEILESALSYGPATVLTNAMLLKPRHLEPLAAAAVRSRYSLEFRVSIDGFDAPSHDRLRGEGTFGRAIEGVQRLLAFGFLPIVTAVQTWPEGDTPAVFRDFVNMLEDRGYAHPRIKLIPALRIGAEENRSGGYRPYERVERKMLEGYDLEHLLCSGARVVTDRGIWVCPILLDAPDGHLGSELGEAAATPFTLSHAACYTCYQYGAICSNAGGSVPEVGVPEVPSA